MAAPRTFAILLLAVAGSLTGHWIGTTLAAPAALVDHSYLGATGAILTPLAIAALGWLGLQGARTVGLADVDVRQLLVLQTAIFIGQEWVELAGAGLPVTDFMTEPAIVLGLMAQLPVAVSTAIVVRLARRVAASVITLGPLVRVECSSFSTPAIGWQPRPIPVRVRGPRGPPRPR